MQVPTFAKTKQKKQHLGVLLCAKYNVFKYWVFLMDL